MRKKLPPNLHIDTLAVRAGIEPSQYGENSEALYLTSGFLQPDAETAARRFAGAEEGFTYGRTSNPSVTAFENRLAALEGTQAAIGASSGMGAILMMGMGLLKSGDHVICSNSMFGSTINLFAREFAKFGVETSFVSQTDAAQWQAAVRPTTKLLFAETPTNPLTDVCDIQALADIAHNAGALLAVDNCFCSPALQRPTELGADLIIHSGTKYLDGQGRVMAGAICGPSSLIVDVFGPVVRTAGMVLAPFNAWVVLKGMETLRHPPGGAERQCARGGALAGGASAGRARVLPRPGIASAARAGDAPAVGPGRGACCPSTCAAATRALRANAFRVIDSAQVISIATNLGDTSRSSRTRRPPPRPADEEQRQAAGIGQGLVRLAVAWNTSTTSGPTSSRGLDSPLKSEPDSPRRRPASSISATSARRCIPGRSRAHGGAFVLRIEDTDLERSTPGSGATPSSKACSGWAWTTTKARSTRCSAWTATARCWRRCWKQGTAYPCYIASPRTRRDARNADARRRREAALRRHLASGAGQDAAGRAGRRAAGGALSGTRSTAS